MIEEQQLYLKGGNAGPKGEFHTKGKGEFHTKGNRQGQGQEQRQVNGAERLSGAA